MEHKLSPVQMKIIITQLLLSVSVFSILFSYSSFFLHSHEKLSFLSGDPFQLLSHVMNKNCVFLICNGLLVFLAKTSGFVPSPSASDINEMLQKNIGDNFHTAVEYKEPFSPKETLVTDESVANEEAFSPKEALAKEIVANEEPKEKEEDFTGEDVYEEKRIVHEEVECMSIHDGPKEITIFIAESDLEDDGGESDKKCWLFDDDEEQDKQLLEENVYGEVDEDEDEEGAVQPDIESLSTEELNQKFEDFIRRTKEEIRINEVQQQLVLVK